MPHFIGDFLSEHVYNDHLKTTHKIASKLSCRLVDVCYGREEQPPDGTSWIVGVVIILFRGTHTYPEQIGGRCCSPYS
jgi:hypothetical protein